MSRSRRRSGPRPSYLRLVGSPGHSEASERLPDGCAEVAVGALMANLRATAVEVTDRAVDALRSEVTVFGLDFDPDTLEAIRKATFITVATGIYGRMERGFYGSDDPPDQNGLAGDSDDNLHPYVEHTGVGLRERLRLILEPTDEPA